MADFGSNDADWHVCPDQVADRCLDALLGDVFDQGLPCFLAKQAGQVLWIEEDMVSDFVAAQFTVQIAPDIGFDFLDRRLVV